MISNNVQSRKEECLYKLSLIRKMLDERGRDGIIIETQPNFSYLSCGGRGFLGLASTAACARLFVSRDKAVLAANNIESPRVFNEELPEGVFENIALPWQEDGGIDEYIKKTFGGNIISDSEAEAAKWFKDTRTVLCEGEINRFRKLCKDCAAAVDIAASNMKQGISEFEAAGMLSQAIWSFGAEPISLFAGADDRNLLYRHFIPTANKANRRIILSVCARQGGLVVSLTRTVYFDGPTAEDIKKNDMLKFVEERTFDSLIKNGAEKGNLGSVFKDIAAAYKEAGYEGEENNHHQGGMTGYLPRESRIDAGTTSPVTSPSAYAFNLTCPGAKREATILLADNKIEVMSEAGNAL